ncbi:hypothetical protein SAMN05892877_103410 [Rhizobium subbaraonis]|uniref:Uncharacterized protein n=1 Tax=Rhizobium subbaraonis TaxID=908946 RepID=A0A285U952_9HYPH|nr:hypothetical protein [Rhizobium subbaraonis]SOC37066.1 hypothetical protein SAMN05892877_103410 [Rhizobium subbaraonis]
MTDIRSPRSPDTPDRLLECEEALEAAFQQLVWHAVQAGWDEEEATSALAMLADNHVLAIEENRQAEAAFRRRPTKH